MSSIFRFDAKVLGRGFGYDVRGKDGPDGNLTPELAHRTGRALGSRLPAGSRVFVTGDARLTTPVLISQLMKGYVEQGHNVVGVGTHTPTGIATWYIIQNKYNGSVVVSGSHNPVGDNGFKITQDGRAVYGRELSSLEELIANGVPDRPLGTLTVIPDIMPNFQLMLGRVFKPYKHQHRIILDCGDGIGGGIMEALQRNGAEVRGYNLAPNGAFPTYGMANPSKEVCTDPLCARVKEANSQLSQNEAKFIGMMLDGDGDRVAFVTEDGRVFHPEKNAALYYREYLRALKAGQVPEMYGNYMALDVRATRSTLAMIAREGGIGYYIQAGYPAHREWASSLIPSIGKQTVTRTSAEASGHFFEPSAFYGANGETYPEFAAALIDDGYFMGMRMMEIIDTYGCTLNELLDQIPSQPFLPETRAKIEAEHKLSVMATMPDAFRQLFTGQLKEQKSDVLIYGGLRIQHPDNGLILVDGVKALLTDGSSALVRASNTGNELSFLFEAPTYTRLAEVVSQVLSVLSPYAEPHPANLVLNELNKKFAQIKTLAAQE